MGTSISILARNRAKEGDEAVTAVRVMEPRDVSAVVTIHRNAFKGYFLTFLGPAFLRELYGAILSDSSGVAYVYQQGATIRGFVAGTICPGGFYGRLARQRWWRFCLASLAAVVRRPGIIRRLFRAFSMPDKYASPQMGGLLMSIGVEPEFQGHHAGRDLLAAFLSTCRARGLTSVSLTTDARNNDEVNHFYQSQGFKLSRNYLTPEGRSINEYVIQLPS